MKDNKQYHGFWDDTKYTPEAINVPLNIWQDGGVQINYRRKKLGARTFFIPLAFMLLHQIFLGLGIMLAAILHNVIKPQADLPEASSLSIVGMIACMVFLIPIYVSYLFGRENKRPNSFLVRKTKPRAWIFTVVSALGSLGLINVLFLIITFIAQFNNSVSVYFDDAIKEYGELVDVLKAKDLNLIFTFIAVVVLVPIAEELLFRGIILGEFIGRMPVSVAVILQAVLFSIFHMNLVQSTYVLIPGIFLGVVYVMTRSIKMSILFHMIFNFFGGFVSLLFEGQLLPQIAVGIVSYLMIIPMLVMTFIYRKRQQDLFV